MDQSEAQYAPRAHGTHVIEWDDDNDSPKPGLCCLQGCLAASSVGFSFLVALPTGIILVVLSTSKDNGTALLASGCALIILPFIVLLIVIFLCLNQNKLSRLKFWEKKTVPNIQPQTKSATKNDINSNTIVLQNMRQLKSTSINLDTGTSQGQHCFEGQTQPNSSDARTVYTNNHDPEIHI